MNYLNQIGVIADLAGTQLTPQDQQFLQQPEIAGIILFSRNFTSPEQLAALTQAIHELRPDLLISVDQEGGRVQRFREGFTRLPAMLTLEALYQEQPQQALTLAQDLGWLMASELTEHGVHLSYAPVLDIERDCSQVIGDRAFGHDAQTVSSLAGAFIDGMSSAGMAAVGKHFPGHGAVVADSHLELPIDDRPHSELDYDMQPFAELIKANKLVGIMPAHVRYPAVDPHYTAGFSALWLQTILRQQLAFDGLIFSDDLSMAGAAAAGGYGERSQKAIHAGCNALLACNNRDAAIEVVATVKQIMTQQPTLTHLNLSGLIPPKPSLTPAVKQRRQAIQQSILSSVML